MIVSYVPYWKWMCMFALYVCALGMCPYNTKQCEYLYYTNVYNFIVLKTDGNSF